MRNLIVFCSVLGLAVSLPRPSNAKPYVLMNLGTGGKARAFSIGVEAGGTLKGSGTVIKNFILGGGVSLAFTGETEKYDYIPDTIPHGDYTLISNLKSGPEGDFYLKGGGETQIFNTKLAINFGLGFSLQMMVDLARSNVTGLYWLARKWAITHITSMWDIYFTVSNAPEIKLELGYHNRRGILFGVVGVF